jgi:inner membrane protein
MDNITHTMVGAALGQAGLKRYSGLGMATLMIAANIPDVDALAIPFTDMLAFRRGWTHGPLGLIVLPALLTAAMVAYDRWGRRNRSRVGKPAVRPGHLLLLAYIGALSHPFLDWLNAYGIRLLRPFSHEWFYGDALFIIDPWLWLLLGGGLFFSRWMEKKRRPTSSLPARVTLAVSFLYIGLMVTGSRYASDFAGERIIEEGIGPVERLAAVPVAVNPFVREIIFDCGAAYGFAVLDFRRGPSLNIQEEFLPVRAGHSAVRVAATHPEIQGFLYWSRFPFFEVRPDDDGYRVYVADARFGRDAASGWSSRNVLVPGTFEEAGNEEPAGRLCRVAGGP